MMFVFNKDDSRWRCCRHRCHVTIGAQIIAGVGLIYNIITTGTDFREALRTGEAWVPVIFDILDLAFAVCAFALLVVGIRKLIPSYLIMQLVIEALSIAACVVMGIVYFVILVAPEATARGVFRDLKSAFPIHVTYSEHESLKFYGGVGIFVFTIGTLVQVWFFMVIYRAYEYIKVKVRAARMLEMAPVEPLAPAVDSEPPAYAQCVNELKGTL